MKKFSDDIKRYNFTLTRHDRKLLQALSLDDGHGKLSATVRDLVRQEAERRGIALDTTAQTEAATTS